MDRGAPYGLTATEKDEFNADLLAFLGARSAVLPAPNHATRFRRDRCPG
ncbi:MAG TPA: hypothetical protein VE650_15205 [Acetobacteraceae bacterium]|nr:hypothetical protein [Acetobacteraceae bacterium]